MHRNPKLDNLGHGGDNDHPGIEPTKRWWKRLGTGLRLFWANIPEIAKIFGAVAAIVAGTVTLAGVFQTQGWPPFDDDVDPTEIPTTSTIDGLVIFQDDGRDGGPLKPIEETPEADPHYFANYSLGNWVMWSDDDEFGPATIRSPVPIDPVANVAIEVRARAVSGDEGVLIAIACRYNRGTGERYQLSLDTVQGKFRIHRSAREPSADENQSTDLVPWTEADAIRPGDAWNHLRLACTGDNISAVINDVPVAALKDDRLVEGGQALVAGRFGDTKGAFEARFDDLVVRTSLQTTAGRALAWRIDQRRDLLVGPAVRLG